jgi:Tol biopolymer transport system component
LFRSLATDLAAGVFNGSENLYMRDLGQGKTYALTSGGFSSAAMTRDGRFVTYGDTSGRLFVWNSSSGSVTYSQTVAGGLRSVAISPDGNKVVYWTAATPQQLVFVDTVAKTNWVVDAASPASKAGLRFSADSRYLTYAATPAAETTSQVYLYDFQSALHIRISRDLAGAGSANGASDQPEISPDGRFVAFRSAASDIVANDTNGVPDLFLFDQATQTTTLLSASESGTGTANNRSAVPLFAPDGQTLVFQSWASDLTSQDFNQSDDIFAATLLYAGISASTGSTQGFQLSWPAMPGKNYRVQFKAALSDAAWIDVSGSITNFDTKDIFFDSAPATAQRFYRVLAY